MGGAHRCHEKYAHGERDGHDPLPGGGFIPTTTDQSVRDPSTNRFGDPEGEEGQRRIKPRSHDAELTNRHEIIRQPRHQHIPVVIKTEESEAYSQQIAIEQAADRGGKICERQLPASRLKAARENDEPGYKPEQSGKAQNKEGTAPSQMNQQPRDQYAFEDEPGARAEIEESRGQAALFGCEEEADDFCSAREVDRFSDPKENAERQ